MIAAAQGRERLEQGVLTFAALAVVTAIWLGIGVPGFPSLFSHGRSANDAPLVAYAENNVQPRPHAVPTIPVDTSKARHRHARVSAPPQPARATPAGSGRRSTIVRATASTPTVARAAAARPRAEPATPVAASAHTAAAAATTESTAEPQTVATNEAATSSHPTSTTQNTTDEAPAPPPPPAPPPVSLPSLPNLPDVPDVPSPSVPPLPALPPTPSVTVPQTPPLPAANPPQLSAVQAPTQTVPTLP